MRIFDWYLDSVPLFFGGFICLAIGAVVASAGRSRGRLAQIIGGILAFVGVISMIYAFAGPGLRPLQFIIVCILVIVAGVNIARSAGFLATVAGVAIAAIAVFALINTSLSGLNIRYLNQDYSASIGLAFRTAGDVLESLLDSATRNDPRPNRREPIR